MNKQVLIAGGAVAAILLIVFIGIPLFSDYSSHGMDIQFYDENGDAIGEPLAFLSPKGDIVAGFTASVWWKVVSTNVDLTSLSITGTLKVSVLNTLDSWNTLDTQPMSFVTAELTYHKSYDFDTLLSNYMGEDYIITGWLIRVESSITAALSDTEGNPLDPQTVTDAAQFLLSWHEGSFTLESGVTFVYS